MYSIKPIIDSNKQLNSESLQTTMYPMKNIYNSSGPGSADSSNKIGESGIASLEIRQDNVLEQLKQLKEKLLSMHGELGICAKPGPKITEPCATQMKQSDKRCAKPAAGLMQQQQNLHFQHSGIKQKPVDTTYLEDIVINANSRQIPYSLRAIKTLWQSRINLKIQTYIHSNTPTISAEAKAFEATLNSTSVTDETIPCMQISLIWKDVSRMEFISTASKYVPIYGEVNILRYLARIGPQEFRYDLYPLAESIEIDSMLDACGQFSEGTSHNQNLIKHLSSKLGKQDFFGGNLVTLIDIAASSAVKQMRNCNVPQPIGQWLQRVTTVVGY